jgi:hypothetical protein
MTPSESSETAHPMEAVPETLRGLLTLPTRKTLASASGSPVVFLLTALLLSSVCTVVSQGQPEVSQLQAVYTGLVRKLQGKLGGDEVDNDRDARFVISFGPDNDEIALKLCMEQGYSGKELGREDFTVRCLREYQETAATSMSSPSVGVSAFDPIGLVWFHASGEDGYSSAYLTGVNVKQNKHGSIGQGSVVPPPSPEGGGSHKSFTLSALKYNSGSDSLFGIITYSDGQHYVVSIKGSKSAPIWDPTGTPYAKDGPDLDGLYASSDEIKKKWKREITFKHIYRLHEATGVVPALGTLEPIRQIYICIVIENDAPYLYVVHSGMDQGGNIVSCPTQSSRDKEVCPECTGCILRKLLMPGVATSMQVFYHGMPV